MDSTPVLSRSGRVLKKSVKLMDLEDTQVKVVTPKPVPLVRQGSPQKSVVSSLITPDSSLANANSSNSSNLKVKLSFSSGDFKVQPNVKETVSQPVMNKLNLSSSKLTIVPSQVVTSSPAPSNVPVKIPIHVVKTSQGSSLILKIKPDEDGSKANPINLDDSGSPVKRVKVEQSSNGIVSQQVRSTPIISVVTTGPQAPSPIIRVGQKLYSSEAYSSSTPKQSIPSSNIARSIQEQRRINLSNKLRQQSSSPTPARTIRTSTPSVPFQSQFRTTFDETDDKKPKKPSISAYVLWCKETRNDYQRTYPELNFIDLSRKMGEIWHSLPNNEKNSWFKKAAMMTKHGASFANVGSDFDTLYMEDEMKPKLISGALTKPITVDTVKTYGETFVADKNKMGVCKEALYEGVVHKVGMELIDIQAHLNVLGDSLMSIGSFLQRGIKYNSEIDYDTPDALSTLLDTALVAMTSLSCLSLAVPQIALPRESLEKNLDAASYLMPPSELV